MPRLKASAAEQAAARFEGLLAAGRMQSGLTITGMCERVGINRRTYEKRRGDPERWYTVGELRKLARVTGIPLRELLGALVPSADTE